MEVETEVSEKKKLLDKSEIFEGLIVGDEMPGISTFWMTLEYFHAHGKMHWLMKAYIYMIYIVGFTYNSMGFMAVFLVDMEYKRRLAALMNPICGLQTVFKCWIFSSEISDYLKLLAFLKPDFLCCVPEEKKDGAKAVYTRNTELTNQFMKYAMTWNAVTLWMVSTMPYVRSQWLREALHVGEGPLVPNKIVESEYLFEWNYTPMYELIFAYEQLAVIIAIATSSAYQAILIFLVMALVGHLKVLGFVLETMKGRDFSHNGQKLDDVAQEKAYQAFIKCVKDHQKLIRAGDALAERYNTFLTFHLSTAILVGIIAIFEFTVAETFADSFKFFVMCGYGLLEVAIYCFCGQMLQNASEDVLRQVYQCEWEELSPKFREAMTLLMVRAKNPLVLKAGRLYPVNFETLGSIQQLVYTALTMLTSTNENEL